MTGTATQHGSPVGTDLSRLSLETLLGIISGLHHRTWSPWAVLLVRFSDDTVDLPSREVYEQLFTSSGAGKGNNMVDFFADMSHGRLDLSGSKVFGWLELPAKRSSYVGNVSPAPAGKLNRGGLLDLARATASAQGVRLADYAGTVVSGLGHVDLCGWIGGMAALCDSYSLEPSLLGQEMGHGYGLDHARRDGSADDYNDPWDIMSTAGWPEMEEPDPEFTHIGPGLNAWSMRSRGWLDESRVWSARDDLAWESTIQLRPLHRRDLPGNLAGQVGPYLVEFRVPERWDAAIPRPCVLVHRFEDNHPYLLSAAGGTHQDLVPGDRFTVGRPDWPYGPYDDIEVIHIDAESHTATIRLTHQPAIPVPQVPGQAGSVFGGVPVDGDGFVIHGGHIVRYPPRGPVTELVKSLVRYLSTELVDDVAVGLAARRTALTSIIGHALTLREQTEPTTEPPPGYARGNGTDR